MVLESMVILMSRMMLSLESLRLRSRFLRLARGQKVLHIHRPPRGHRLRVTRWSNM